MNATITIEACKPGLTDAEREDVAKAMSGFFNGNFCPELKGQDNPPVESHCIGQAMVAVNYFFKGKKEALRMKLFKAFVGRGAK